MTTVAIEYLKTQEAERANRAMEQIRLSELSETTRANIERERETRRANTAREDETHRYNVSMETLRRQELAEAHRSHLANELLSAQNLEETKRSNKAREDETKRANQAQERIKEYGINLSTLGSGAAFVAGPNMGLETDSNEFWKTIGFDIVRGLVPKINLSSPLFNLGG